LKAARDDAAAKEHIFQRELATAQRLTALYKEGSEERGRKCTELEGIIQELQKHLEVVPCAALRALSLDCDTVLVMAHDLVGAKFVSML
jgi:hypothetical protein